MTVYLASPTSQAQGAAVRDMPVLMSYAMYRGWVDGYQQSWGKILIDSGAYSELTSGKSIDLEEYKDFAARWSDRAEAIAALDDISGDWRRGLRNLEQGPGFPTIHSSDPEDLLEDLIPAARERGGWIGVGILPPRTEKHTDWLERTLERIPPDLHVHGWALRKWWNRLRRIDSVDSTNWWRDAMSLRSRSGLGFLTYSECLEIVVKRYKRERRTLPPLQDDAQQSLFEV